jgi:hypothetical protein
MVSQESEGEDSKFLLPSHKAMQTGSLGMARWRVIGLDLK